MVKQRHVRYSRFACRAASIDRGIFLEAAAAGLRTRGVEGTRKAVPGGLEGAVYEVSQPKRPSAVLWGSSTRLCKKQRARLLILNFHCH